MKVVILAGGFGSRLSEETSIKPKPMIEIGGLPLIVHIMQNFTAQGYNEFIICLGYKGHIIKEYFENLLSKIDDVDSKEFDSGDLHPSTSKWKIDLVDTGINTMTGGRIKRIREFTDRKPFILTYGDGLANIDLVKLVQHHKLSGCLATVTAVTPPARFGALDIDDLDKVKSFKEKFNLHLSWINGGFFVLEPEIFDFIEGDSIMWEKEPLIHLVEIGELSAYKHLGFWKPCDTLREKHELEELWVNNPPWKNW